MIPPGAVTPGAEHHPGLARAGTGGQRCTEGGVPQNTTPRLLGSRVDALYLAFAGEVDERAVALLRARSARARMSQTAVAVELAPGVTMTLSPKSREGRWYLQHGEMRAVVDLDAPGGKNAGSPRWTVEVEPSALLLARAGARACLVDAEGLAALLLTAVRGRRVRRVDLCADFDGFDLQSLTTEAFIRPSWKSRAEKYYDTAEYADHRQRVTGYALGRGDTRMRVYDKCAELLRPEADPNKREQEFARFRAAGWDGLQAVVRVEFQLRGETLKEFEDEDEKPWRDDPRRLLGYLDRLWRYFTTERITKNGREPGWTRIAVPGSATRRERWKLDPRWQAVQSVRFGGQSYMAVRVRRRATLAARRAVMQVLTVATMCGLIAPHKRDESASPDRAASYVRSILEGPELARCFDAMRAEVAEELLERGEREAETYLIEYQGAALARASELHAALQERARRAA